MNLPVREVVVRVLGFLRSTPANFVRLRRQQNRAIAQNKKIHFIVLTGRFGDILAAEPAIRKLKREGDYIVWLVRPSYADVLSFNPNIDAIIAVTSDMEAMILRYFYKKMRWSNLTIDRQLCNIFGIRVSNPSALGIDATNFYRFGSLADVRSLIATGEKSGEIPRLYPDPSFDAGAFLGVIFSAKDAPLLVFHPASDEFARSWEVDKAQRFADWVLENTDCNILEVGLKPYLRGGARTYLLRGELPLSWQLAVVKKARLFVGVDSGFSHVANAAAVNSILLIGKYLGFADHLPWQIKPQDIVIRSDGQAHEIPVSDVTKAVIQMLEVEIQALT